MLKHYAWPGKARLRTRHATRDSVGVVTRARKTTGGRHRGEIRPHALTTALVQADAHMICLPYRRRFAGPFPGIAAQNRPMPLNGQFASLKDENNTALTLCKENVTILSKNCYPSETLDGLPPDGVLGPPEPGPTITGDARWRR